MTTLSAFQVLVEISERARSVAAPPSVGEQEERVRAVGHVGRLRVVPRRGGPTSARAAAGREQRQRGIAQRAAAALAASGENGPFVGHLGVEVLERAAPACAPISRDQRAMGAVDERRVDVLADDAGDVGLRRQLAATRRDRRARVRRPAWPRRAPWRSAGPRARLLPCAKVRDRCRRACASHKLLAACQRLNRSLSLAIRNSTSSSGEVDRHVHGRGEPAQQRRHRARGHIDEAEGLLALGERHDAVGERVAVVELQRDVVAVGAEQAEPDRDVHRLLVRLAGRRRAAPARPRARPSSCPCRSAAAHTSSGVPACEYQSRNCVRSAPLTSSKQRDELLDRRRLAVVALEIEVHALAEGLAARAGSAACARPRRPSRRRSPCRSC